MLIDKRGRQAFKHGDVTTIFSNKYICIHYTIKIKTWRSTGIKIPKEYLVSQDVSVILKTEMVSAT